ncbi:MAG: hypothetical protein NZ550_00180 [Fimbriimonadales bacterium]|nr:hypothetical protein [Fimbriimonadales bacterium]
MRRGLWYGVVWSIALATALAQPAALQEDPLLQRRITVWLKLEPMRDALRFIARQTGVSLRCQDAIAEEKVAIFVENRPAHEILTQLARVFRYEWRLHEDGGYILYVPDETRFAEERLARYAGGASQSSKGFSASSAQSAPDEPAAAPRSAPSTSARQQDAFHARTTGIQDCPAAHDTHQSSACNHRWATYAGRGT